MSYIVYKLIHFSGIFIMIAALSASAMYMLGGGTRATNPYRRQIGAAHGIAGFLILLGGFGMLARLGIVHGGLPVWVWLKLAVWSTGGAALFVVYRGPGAARLVLLALPVLTLLGAAIALYKPL